MTSPAYGGEMGISDDDALGKLESINPDATAVRDGAPVRALSAAVDAGQVRVGGLVGLARRGGASWVEVAAALGTSPEDARRQYERRDS